MSAGATWVPVTKAQFFAALGSLDVHPRPERELTTWETRARQAVGRSLGYAVPYGTPERWELKPARAAAPAPTP